ncbi:MAG: response regulator [bacterium]
MGAPLKILLVEDNNDHAELITRSLSRALPSTQIRHINTHRDCLPLLEKKRFDIILMDYYLDDTLGIHLLREINERHPETPVVIVTGQGDEKTAARSIKAGAEDYVVKTRESLEALPRIISRTIQKHKARLRQKKGKARHNHSHANRLLSGVFREIEQISDSLQSIYKRLNGGKPTKKPAHHEIKKLPLLEKQMAGLKTVVKKLFRAG